MTDGPRSARRTGPRDVRKGGIGVLIVDDSRTARATIRAALEGDGRFRVVGEAADAYTARDAIKSLRPDILTLDVEMPGMNGLTFLKNLMRLRPMPVVMVSSRTTGGSAAALTALSFGAIDCVDIRSVAVSASARGRLAERLFAAACARVSALGSGSSPKIRQAGAAAFDWNGKVVLIGSSTGGVDALERVLSCFPEDGPPTLVAQHMPAGFLAHFAERLDGAVAPKVLVPEAGARAMPGHVYFAPGGDRHIALAPGATARIALPEDDGAAHVPSVDVLFNSALPRAGRVVAAVLTGMGRDGAEAMKALRDGGAETVVQDARTSVVDGMPAAARALGAAGRVLPLDEIAGALLELASKSPVGGAGS